MASVCSAVMSAGPQTSSAFFGAETRRILIRCTTVSVPSLRDSVVWAADPELTPRALFLRHFAARWPCSLGLTQKSRFLFDSLAKLGRPGKLSTCGDHALRAYYRLRSNDDSSPSHLRPKLRAVP